MKRWLSNAIHTYDDGYILVGYEDKDTSRYSEQWDISVIKIDSEGELQWQRSYGELREDYEYVTDDLAFCGIETADSCYIIGGRWQSIWEVDHESEHQYPSILKINRDGEPVWFHDYPDYPGRNCHDIVQVNDGTYFAICFTSNGIVHIGENGQIIDETFCNVVNFSSIEKTVDGENVIAVGQTTGKSRLDAVLI